jgi:hypothetical protein
MKEWLVRLEGNMFDLQELPVLFSSPKATVLEEDGNYYLKSTDFNSLTDAGDVLATANRLLQILNGAAALHLENFLAVQIHPSVIGIDQDGERHRFGFGYGTGRPVLKSTQQPARVESWIALAGQSENVADALRFFCEQNWINLYKIYEIVRDDVGDLHRCGWVTKKAIKRFTQTAQSRDALGDAARHASDKYKAHPKPMSLSEAKSFIRTILLNWLHHLSGN